MGAVRAGLAERADASKAEQMRAYMKSAMPYRGISSPVLRQLLRELFARHLVESAEDWRATILELWNAAEYREERYAALALVGQRRYAPYRTLEALPLYEYLIVSGAWWDLVDGMATHEVADLLRRYPAAMRSKLLGWSQHSDPWLRRAAIIAQVGLKRATDRDLLYACIEPNLAEGGFFLRKAIGWALREYAKVAPSEVRRYVAEHEGQLSGLSRREALKHLSHLQSAPASV